MCAPHISVCVCTYKRPIYLGRLLTGLLSQRTSEAFGFSIVVADNDPAGSAAPVVREAGRSSAVSITYCVEKEKSISLARNASLRHARGSLVAFIDDDEVPATDWLLQLFSHYSATASAGVFGPVEPVFEVQPPSWVSKAGLYDRPSHDTGYHMPWGECRTGNVLLDRRVLDGIKTVFRPEFGAGGSDIDLFRRLIEAGHEFTWCHEAVVYETVPPERWKRSFLIKRALLRGRLNLEHPRECRASLWKSVAAVPIYVLALPFCAIMGQHVFMKYFVKLCDHGGRLLATVGLNPVRERVM